MQLLVVQMIVCLLLPTDCFTFAGRRSNQLLVQKRLLAREDDQDQFLFDDSQTEELGSEDISQEFWNEVEQGRPSEWQIMKEVQ